MQEKQKPLSDADIAVAMVTIFILLSLVLPLVMYVSHLGAAGCGDACDTETSWSAVIAFTVFDGVLFVATMVPFALSAKRWKRSWPIPATGLVVLTLSALIAYVVIRIAIPTL